MARTSMADHEDLMAWARDMERDDSSSKGDEKKRCTHISMSERSCSLLHVRGGGTVSSATEDAAEDATEAEEQQHSGRPAGADLEIEAGGLRHTPSVVEKESGSSIMSCIANLANTNMGVGMLALPSAMADAGMVGGIALLLLSAAIATFGSHLLAECVGVVGRPATMSKVTRHAMAPQARCVGVAGILLADFAVTVIGTSCAIGYLIVVGDTIPEIKAWLVGEGGHSGGAEPSIFDSRQFWIFAVLPVIAPLAYLRKIDSLRFASYLVVFCAAARGDGPACERRRPLPPARAADAARFDRQPTPVEPPSHCAGRGRLGRRAARPGQSPRLPHTQASA